ncbi:hypothetical protein AB0A60_15900 [Streptomyces sp. NPDC046275]|uniref:hypothetical protein n=1 Tax=Streptomyces sp. NPDC046275 TaxID=3157201 RepID=UPI0033FF005A
MTGTPLGPWPVQLMAGRAESIGLDSVALAALTDPARAAGHAGTLADLALERPSP